MTARTGATPRGSGRTIARPHAMLTLAALIILATCAGPQLNGEATQADRGLGRAALDARPLATSIAPHLYFEPNRGQASPDIAYVGHGRGYRVYVRQDAVEVVPLAAFGPGPRSPSSIRVGLAFADANPHARISAAVPLDGRTNYLVGVVGPRPLLNIPRFGQVRYTDLYPGVDLPFYENGGRLEYDLTVAGGADPSAIALRLTGPGEARLEADGSVVVEAAGRRVVHDRPVIFQEIDGQRRAVEGGFTLRDSNTIGFWLGRYDPRRPLVIDPVLEFSTYMTGDGADAAHAVAVDINHNTGIYVAGRVLSDRDFPITEGSYKDEHEGARFQYVVAKLTPAGDRIVFSTYFPAPIADIADAGLVGVYLAGKGCEFHFDPDARRDLSKCGIYAARLNAAGTKLDGWKVLSGPGLNDNFNQVTGIAAGPGFAVYVAGTIVTGELPTTPGVAQPKAAGSSDAFVVKFDISTLGATVKFATYLGGSHSDGAAGIAHRRVAIGLGEDLRFEDMLVVSGYTSSRDFPVTSGAFQQTRKGPTDAFVAKLDSFTGKLIAATYLGGFEREFMGTESGGLRSGSVGISFGGKVYVVGSTESPNFPLDDPLPNLSQAVNGRVNDAFVTSFWPDLSTTFRSTRLGGSGAESDLHIRVHNTDETIYVLGNTRSSDFPLKDPIQNAYGGGTSVNGDLFIAKMRFGELIYSTYLGGRGFDDGNDIDIDLNDNVYLVGSTGTGFPLKNALQPTPGGSESWFIAKIAGAAATPAESPTAAPSLTPSTGGKLSSARVTKTRYDPTLGHNIPNLDVGSSNDNRLPSSDAAGAGVRFDTTTRQANFLDFYDRTGGIERWGLPTSEVFEENPGTLSQYYQRGVVDWKPAPGGGPHTLQRRLAWDFIGGGLVLASIIARQDI